MIWTTVSTALLCFTVLVITGHETSAVLMVVAIAAGGIVGVVIEDARLTALAAKETER